jgi:hypothetical protein
MRPFQADYLKGVFLPLSQQKSNFFSKRAATFWQNSTLEIVLVDAFS